MRRSFVTVGFALLVGASIVQAQSQQEPAAPSASQTPAAAAPAQAAAPAADPLRFTTDDAAIVLQVAPGKGADVEAGFAEMFKALAASAKPELKAFGATMKLFKVSAGTPADQPSLYMLVVTGALKELSYNYGKIIYYSGKEPAAAYDGIFPKQEDATPIYTKLKDGITSINPWPLAKIGG